MAVRDFFTVTSTLTLVSVGVANQLLSGSSVQAFVGGQGRPQQSRSREGHVLAEAPEAVAPAVASAQEVLGLKGLVGFGASFGAALALVRGVTRQQTRVTRKAAEIEVKDQTETKPVAYLENIPRTIIEKRYLTRLLATLPKEQWANPPEEHPLYTLKMYAETYGEGKATKMSWWDFWYLQTTKVDEDTLNDLEELQDMDRYFREVEVKGHQPIWVFVPPFGEFRLGPTIQFKGKEPFAGDQVRSIVADGRFAKQFLASCAFYREGLQPWQRGLEIGMAHGYFIIGPFVSLGPLRNTPEAATAGLLAGCALIGIVSCGGLLFGATAKPKLFDKPGQPRASGFQELINWHAIGGIGGAGFAHALITIFGSG